MSYNLGSNGAHNFKSALPFVQVWFWNYSGNYSLNCTHSVQLLLQIIWHIKINIFLLWQLRKNSCSNWTECIIQPYLRQIGEKT